MLHRPTPRAVLAGLVLLSMAAIPGPAPADTYFETVYLPTSSVISLPSSSVLATSYVVPTAYTTSYLPTSSIVTTGDYLVPTSTIVRRSILRPRRYVERTSYTVMPTTYVSPTSYVLPTSYVVPTSYVSSSYVLPTSYVSSYVSPTSYVLDNGVVTTSATSYPCETPSTPAPTTKSSANRSSGDNGGGASIVSEPTNAGSSNERRPSAVLNSSPSGEEGILSNVNPPVSATVPPPVTTPGARPDPTTPPAGPMPEMDPTKIPLPEPGKSGAQPNETTYRTARRSTYDVRNILRGRVISAESRRPEEGVSVIVSSLTKNYSDRNAMTDADGDFKVSLPDGDWTVKVRMPSGSIYTVGRDFVTANNGRVTDSAGRNVAEFLITR